jgi:zinc D-Ala-D-Ala carboxypeptidase
MDFARYFTLDELKHSNTATAEGIPNDPGPAEIEALRALCAAVLDPLREALDKPISINCAYRGPALNKRVGGVTNSQHLTGQAADIQSPAISVVELFKLIIRQGLPYDQIIYEARNATSKWVHVSHIDGANRGEIRVAKFGADGKPQSYPLISKADALAMSEPVTRGPAEPLTYEEGEDEPQLDIPVAAAKQAVAVKAAVKKIASKKAAATQPVAKQGTAQKVVAKPAPSKKAAAKKAAVKKVAEKRAPAKRAARKT